MVEKVIIIGSGPAGLSAAIYTSREGFGPLVIAGTTGGGQLELTTTVENFPGFPDGITGPELVGSMRRQAERFGARILAEDLAEIDLSRKPITVKAGGKTYETKTLIIATGANAKTLGLAEEKGLIGRGISTCATCDGPFYRNKDVVVVGGGDTAMEDSNFLTNFAKSVTIVHRKDAFRASKIMQERTLSNKKIKVLWNTTVDGILGSVKVTGVRLRNVLTDKVSEMQTDGVFMAIGYSPNTKVFEGKLKLDEQGYISVKDEVLTEIEGVYVAGDVADRVYRQAITASASGVKCALHVREYLSRIEYENGIEASG